MQTGKRKLQVGLQQWMQALPFLLAGFVLMALFVLYPLVRNIWISCTDFNVIQNRPNAWVGLRNYLSLLSDQNYRIAFRNTILYALVTVPGQMACGLVLACLVNSVRRGQTAGHHLLGCGIHGVQISVYVRQGRHGQLHSDAAAPR